MFFACIDVIARREVAGDAFGPIVAHRDDEGGGGAVGGREEKSERGGFDRMIGDGFEGVRLGVCAGLRAPSGARDFAQRQVAAKGGERVFGIGG